MDWKEALLAKSQQMGIEPTEDTSTPESAETQEFDPKKHPALHIVMEKKGRGGKTATIIEGFTWPDEQVKRLATQLKSRLGVGGSARGGEILIQGDCREKVRELLKSQGFKLK